MMSTTTRGRAAVTPVMSAQEGSGGSSSSDPSGSSGGGGEVLLPQSLNAAPMESVVSIIDGIEPASAEGNVYSSDQEASVGMAAVRSGDGIARVGIGTGGGGSAINDGINGHNIEVAMEELKAATESAKEKKNPSTLKSNHYCRHGIRCTYN